MERSDTRHSTPDTAGFRHPTLTRPPLARRPFRLAGDTPRTPSRSDGPGSPDGAGAGRPSKKGLRRWWLSWPERRSRIPGRSRSRKRGGSWLAGRQGRFSSLRHANKAVEDPDRSGHVACGLDAVEAETDVSRASGRSARAGQADQDREEVVMVRSSLSVRRRGCCRRLWNLTLNAGFRAARRRSATQRPARPGGALRRAGPGRSFRNPVIS